MIFTAVFLVWASLSEVDESVHGQGNVVPSGQTKIIQHLEGGIIDEIYIKEGEVVKKDQSLFKLSQAFFLSDQQEKQIELYSLYAEEARLQAEIDEQESVAFDKSYKEKIPHIIKNEQSVFEVNRRSFNEELSILKEGVSKKEFEIIEMTNKLSNLQTELTISKENVTIQESLVKQGASSRQMYLQALATKQNFITQSESLKNSIPIVKNELEEAQKKYENFKSKEHAKQLKELREIRISITKLLKRSEANSDREVRKTITSPVNGTVKKMYFHTIGGIVKPGDPVVEITPIGDSLMIVGQIKTSDRARVWIGQTVSVSISAFDFSRYGALDGTLIAISPDSFVDNKGVSYYEVKIKTDKASFSETELVLPGMSAEINILTGKKTIMEYILKPLKDIKQNALREH
jgi:HlyD family secretion protein/adhesin transport system membrane fusion protein